MSSLNKHFPDLGVIGGGNMAGAILRGTAGRGLLDADRVWVSDTNPAQLEALKKDMPITTTGDSIELVQKCRTVLLAVKPYFLLEVLDQIRAAVTPEHRLISIAAGMPMRRMEEHLPAGTRIIRVMPNTPAMIGMGAAGVAPGGHSRAEDLEAALELFRAVGIAFEVNEPQIDAVCALSGSGPAYIFRVMEILMETGVEMGLSADVAKALTYQMVLGAARLANESPEDAAELRRRVTSPKGTTEAALKVWEDRGFKILWKAGVLRARDRSIEIANG